jgi:uncharacterized membrane protein YadS
MNDPQHNPYAPPKAPVAEPPERAPADAPPPVKTAMKLFWISFFLTFVEMALDWETTVGDLSTTFVLIFMAIMCSLQIWLYLNIARGRNWARITWLVLFAISLLGTAVSIPELAGRSLYATVLAIDLLIVLYAFYLVFFPGRDWFGPRS